METNSHEVIVLLIALVIGVVVSLFGTNQRGCGRAMVAIGDVKSRHFSKLFCDDVDVVSVGNNPELVSETIDRRDEVVLRRVVLNVLVNQFVKHLVVWIGKEHGFDVGIVHANVFHAVFFLVLACQFVLLDGSV